MKFRISHWFVDLLLEILVEKSNLQFLLVRDFEKKSHVFFYSKSAAKV
jgi:hypothetical protein